MKINKAKASNYDSVRTECIINYGNEYLEHINEMFADITKDNVGRSDLKTIVAELETIEKRLNAVNGRY